MTSTVPKTTLTVPGVSLARVIASESVKFRSLRSTIALLIGAVILIVGAGPAMVTLVAEPMAAADWNPGRDPFSPHDPAAAVLYGVLFAQLPIGVLGVLIASSEYGTGMIRATLAAVPTRLPVLWAKVTVTGLVSFVLMLAATIAAYLIGQGIFASAGVELDLSDQMCFERWSAHRCTWPAWECWPSRWASSFATPRSQSRRSSSSCSSSRPCSGYCCPVTSATPSRPTCPRSPASRSSPRRPEQGCCRPGSGSECSSATWRSWSPARRSS